MPATAASAGGRLAGSVVFVTGGARGQGAALARRVVAESGRVFVTDVLDADGEALAGKLCADAGGPVAAYRRLDVRDEAGWAAAVAACEQEFGGLDALVNNAGVLLMKRTVDTTVEEYRWICEINQLGVFLGIRAVIPGMKARRRGSIVNISSVEGLGGAADTLAYTATKFAVRGMTKAAAVELGRFGVRVNSVHPGGIDTPMIRPPGDDEKARADGDAIVAAIGSMVPLKRAGQPEEVAAMVAWLCSDEASYCTGAEFVVDGGAICTSGFAH